MSGLRTRLRRLELERARSKDVGLAELMRRMLAEDAEIEQAYFRQHGTYPPAEPPQTREQLEAIVAAYDPESLAHKITEQCIRNMDREQQLAAEEAAV